MSHSPFVRGGGQPRKHQYRQPTGCILHSLEFHFSVDDDETPSEKDSPRVPGSSARARPTRGNHAEPAPDLGDRSMWTMKTLRAPSGSGGHFLCIRLSEVKKKRSSVPTCLGGTAVIGSGLMTHQEEKELSLQAILCVVERVVS